MPDVFTVLWTGHLRYVNGKCFFDDSKVTEAFAPFPFLNGMSAIKNGKGRVIEFDGQRVRISIHFLDEEQ